MKQFFAFLLICCVACQAFVRTAWTLHYQWNKAVYLEKCENRGKSGFHCDGKCYLKKQMAASENANPKEPQLPAGFHQIKDIQLYFEPAAVLPRFITATILAGKFPMNVRYFLPDAPLTGVFKPPTA